MPFLIDTLQYITIVSSTHACRECTLRMLTLVSDKETVFQKHLQNVKIWGFHDHIWNHHEKCTKKSTNMPGIKFQKVIIQDENH